MKLGSQHEIQTYDPAIYKIDQVCSSLEKEVKKARKAVRERQRIDEEKHAAKEEKIQKLQAWIEGMATNCKHGFKEDIQDKHGTIASSHVAGTGAAFVSKVQEWLEAKQTPTFLAYGPPGVGKTHLACAVISHHCQQPLTGVDGMAYIYFTYDERDQQTPHFMYAGIVSQLLGGSSPLREEMFRLLEEQKRKWQILDNLRDTVASLSPSNLLVFDALDEASEETQEELLNLLERSRSDSPRILITSRSAYQESFPPEQVLRYRVRADADDILAFSKDRLKNRNVKRIVKAQYGTGAKAQQFMSAIAEKILLNSQEL